MLAHPQQVHPNQRPKHRRQQQGQRQYLPATPGAEQRQQLEVAIAHAFLAGNQLEHPVHRPQAEVPDHRAAYGIGQGHPYPEVIDDQPKPQPRQHDGIGQ
ncbi:hypothetical protein D3C81_1982620 [compost metagenome]